MSRLLHAVVICISAVLVASASGGPAQAASGQPVPTVAIGLIIQEVAPTLLQVSLRYTCQPSPTSVGDLSVLVTQSAPLPAQAQGLSDLTCDGAPHDLVVPVVGGPAFAAGPALATAQACSALICGSDSRKVTIAPSANPIGAGLPPKLVARGSPLR